MNKILFDRYLFLDIYFFIVLFDNWYIFFWLMFFFFVDLYWKGNFKYDMKLNVVLLKGNNI